MGSRNRCPLGTLLCHTSGIHVEEHRIHEKLKDLLLPGALGVGIAGQAAQELGCCTKAWHVVRTAREHEQEQEARSAHAHIPIHII